MTNLKSILRNVLNYLFSLYEKISKLFNKISAILLKFLDNSLLYYVLTIEGELDISGILRLTNASSNSETESKHY